MLPAALVQQSESSAGIEDAPQLPQEELSRSDGVTLADILATKEEPQHDPDDLWRWERHGHGKYKGRWYRWRRIGDTARRTLKGGKFESHIAALPARQGQGNHTKGDERRGRTTTRRNTAGMGGDIVADAPERAEGRIDYPMPDRVARR